MRVLVALGGNAITSPDGGVTPTDQVAAISRAMEPVADLVAAGHEVVLTHGNGPQVGNLLVKNEIAASVVPPVPLDWCDAQTQATVGFMVLNRLDAALAARGVRRPTAVLVSRTLVDADDPAFSHPTKPVGRYLPRGQAQPLIDAGQTWQDRGTRGWRRVVPSPEPLEALDAEGAAALVGAGYVVVTGGGGGIPCVRDPSGTVHGVEAVVDKDLSAVLLGRALGADVLVIATDVAHVTTGWGTAHQHDLRDIDVARLRELAARGEFASGSMAPKVEAACRFVERGGRHAAVCTLPAIAAAALARAGTVVRPTV
ncbi:MAG: carbamate kinase [Angustibacter sp.]